MHEEQPGQGVVLIVDDTPANLGILFKYLTNFGFEVLLSQDGRNALEQAEQEQPDVILLDIMMPGMDGFETCQQLKHNPATSALPVIFITALSDTVDKVKGFQLGGVDYITKPFQPEEVLARVTTHITLRNLQRRLQVQNAQLEEKNHQLQQEIAVRTRVEEALRQHIHKLALLNEMSARLQECYDEGETYEVMRTSCQQLFPLHTGALALVRAGDEILDYVMTWGTFPDVVEGVTLQKGTGTPSSMPEIPEGYEGAMIRTRDETLGLLLLGTSSSSPETEEAKDTRSLEAKRLVLIRIAEHYALALHNLRLRETLRIEAIHDQLTNLYNRRYMEEFLEQEIRRAKRHHTPVGLIMLDIDHFKSFNDSYGHETGDLVLKELGSLLRRNIRGEDIACRFGGEEFLLILPETPLKTVVKRAQDIRVEASTMQVCYQEETLTLTISLGVAELPTHGSTRDHILKAVDTALYQAKDQGRDQVVVAQ